MKKSRRWLVRYVLAPWCGAFISFTLYLHPPAAQRPHSSKTERLCVQEVDQRAKVKTVSFPLPKSAASSCCELAGRLALCSPDSHHGCSWGFGTYSETGRKKDWEMKGSPVCFMRLCSDSSSGLQCLLQTWPPPRLTDVHSSVFLALLFLVQCGDGHFIKPAHSPVSVPALFFFFFFRKK